MVQTSSINQASRMWGVLFTWGWLFDFAWTRMDDCHFRMHWLTPRMRKDVVIGAPHFEPVKLYHDVKIFLQKDSMRIFFWQFVINTLDVQTVGNIDVSQVSHSSSLVPFISTRGTKLSWCKLVFSFHASCPPPGEGFSPWILVASGTIRPCRAWAYPRLPLDLLLQLKHQPPQAVSIWDSRPPEASLFFLSSRNSVLNASQMEWGQGYVTRIH